MKSLRYSSLLLLIPLLACNMDKKEVIIHGHRGCRGLWPENTLMAFQEALKLGITTIELDVVITKDGHILVSHDPFMQHEVCSMPDSSAISEEDEMALNIFQMTSEEAQQYWVGLNKHPRFPNQQLFGTHKPTLAETVRSMNLYAHNTLVLDNPITWNIEIKSRPEWDTIYHPEPKEYVTQFLRHFNSLNNPNEYIIQSFDPRILEELHKQAPDLRLVYLSDDEKMSAEEKLKELSFTPYGYSPNFTLVNDEVIEHCNNNNIELIVWTVNEETDLKRMIDLGITQIITDYPDRALALLRKK